MSTRYRFGVRAVFGVLAACTLPASSAVADILIDNLAEPTRGITVLGVVDPDAIWAAQSFISPSRVRLDSIQTLLGNAAAAPDAVARLRSGDDPGGPNLTAFSLPALAPAAMEVVTLLPDTPVTLEPGVRYWLVFGAETSGAFGWAYAQGNNHAGNGTLAEYAYSGDQGATWGVVAIDDPYHVRVDVTAICPADFNESGAVTVQDIFDFLAAYFGIDPRADFNRSSEISVQDIFDFLAAFFAGC